ncbi:MAG: DUF6134 family protein [Dongiaceae bacterium]
MTRRFLGILMFALSLALPAMAGAADGVELASFPPPGQLKYTISRDGDQIGSQSVEFIRNGRQLIVRSRVDIAVKFLGIKVYVFKHSAEEEWTNGQLTRLNSVTDDDGDDRKVDLVLEGDVLRGMYNGARREFPVGIIPTSFWHPDTVTQTVLLDQVKCRTRDVQITDKGIEQITIKGHKVGARHYSMTGQIKRELWYGPDGQLAMLRFPAKDGSEITVKLR